MITIEGTSNWYKPEREKMSQAENIFTVNPMKDTPEVPFRRLFKMINSGRLGRLAGVNCEERMFFTSTRVASRVNSRPLFLYGTGVFCILFAIDSNGTHNPTAIRKCKNHYLNDLYRSRREWE